MEAPDKIYIRPMPNPSDGYVGIAWDKPIPMCETYIRKDALLEWAKEKAETLFEKELDSEKDYGARTAFLEMIVKIESL